MLAQDPAPIEPPAAPNCAACPPCTTAVAPAVVVDASPAAPVDPEIEVRRTRAVLQAFADQGAGDRMMTAVGSGAVAAGLLGASITYVAVARGDGQLSRLNADDTALAGYVLGGAAVVPAAIMAWHIAVPSSEEARLAAFDASDAGPPQERVAAARASVAAEAAAPPSFAPVVGGGALIVGGLGAGALGAYFLLLPHLEDPRGPITHSTGAELIGSGVAALGIGVALIAASSSSAAPTQLQLLAE